MGYERIFPDKYVPHVEASDAYKRWAKGSPNDKARWIAFRDALLAGSTPDPPSMSTLFGKSLVDAGELHMSVLDLGAVWPSPTFPASYYTGPLGQNNILPASATGALLILWEGVDGYSWTQIQGLVQQREQQAGRTFDGIGIHYGGGGTFQGFPTCSYANPSEQKEQWVHDRGSIPIVSWSPDRTIADINAGNADGCIRAMADYFKSYGFRIMLRPFWEFNGNWLLWSYGGDSAGMISAFRRMVTLFQERGASNVGFFWCPQEGFDRPGAYNSYPGDQYVDWVGSDAYAFAVTSSDGYAYPHGPGWAEFGQVFHYTGSGNDRNYHDLFGGGAFASKPFVVGETGVRPDPNNTTRKGNWYRFIAPYALGQMTLPNTVGGGMPYLKGVQFFDQDVSVSEPGNNWRFDYPSTQPDALAGAIEMMQHSFFNVGVLGGAT